MIQDDDCLAKYGPASDSSPHLVLWKLPAEIIFGAVPKKIFCNKDLIYPLTLALRLVKSRGLQDQIKTWDGCFNIRMVRGSTTRPSLHSWGVAIDINAFENGLGQIPKMTPELVKCFTDVGFDWGGNWRRLDGMHFQLSKI